MMRLDKLLALPEIITLGVCLALSATPLDLNVIRLPERRTVEVNMISPRRIPESTMKAKIRFEEGQSRIEIDYDNMKPAVLFGGDITCYVLWAVSRDGGFENLGELWVRPERDKDSLLFSTGLRTFALLVTAEPYYQVERPSQLVITWNDPSTDPQAPSDQLSFSSFASLPKIGFETLANVRYDGKTPLDVVQAEKAFEIAGRMKAQESAPELYREAETTLQQSKVMAQNSQARRGAQEYARRSVASSNEAIKIALRTERAKELEELIAQRQAKMKLLEDNAAESEKHAAESEARAQNLQREAETAMAELQKQRQAAEASIADLNRQIEGVRAERTSLESQKQELESNLTAMRQEQSTIQASLAAMQGDLDRVKREKAALEGRLQQALSLVAETRESARGFIVNLPDILFDVNQAALKPEAQVAIAKLAGILLIMQDLNLRIEGHTDSTGSAAYNLNLSKQRAESVLDFLNRQGIASERMRAFGYGLERPIADNSTAEGRSRNRRVEIVIAEGVVREDQPPRQ
jgi:outer membrane protein OmpA-like peptidoglycan-associated protein